MKFFVLFVGLLSLLFFNQGEIKNGSNYRHFSITDKNCCFESGHADSIWNFEKNESNIFELSNKKLSENKKRLTGNACSFLNNTAINHEKSLGSLPILNSKANLFLIYQFTLSLWQVFLQ
jgi:hypothetical protein